MSELTLQIPDEVLARLQSKAELQNVSLDDLVLELFEEYLDEDFIDDDEPSKEEILADLREALRDVIAGKEGRPADEVLAEIRRETASDADHR